MTLCLLNLLASCTTPDPEVKGNTFKAHYEDLVGSVQAEFQVTGWNLPADGKLELFYDLKADFSRWSVDNIRNHVKGVWVAWAGERLFDSNGHYRQMVNVMMSTSLTTTGVAIENNQPVIPSRKMGHVCGTPFDFVQYFPLEKGTSISPLRLKGSWTRELDGSVPPGLYRLTFDIILDTDKFGPKQWACAPALSDNNPEFFASYSYNPLFLLNLTKTFHPRWYLPMLQVGEAKKPRLPWVLFPEIRSNGNPGVVAEEDKDRFALSSRLRYPAQLIMDPGQRSFYPVFITNFPLAGKPNYVGGAVYSQDVVPQFLNYEDGHVSVRVISPDHEVHPLGTKRFVSERKGGPQLEDGDFSFDFNQWGKYTIVMEGQIRDILGRTLEGGGTYEVWIGRWLTFSSSVKPGTHFLVGNRFPAKIEVNPPCPADLTITVDYYPMSDKSRKRTYLLKGRANTYGYYLPSEGTTPLVFNEPGEYRSDFSATFKAPDGTLWYGNQVSVGIIEGLDSRVSLHGMRSSDSGILDMNKENFGMEARYELHDESTVGLNLFDMSDCYDHMIPFYSGDVLYMTSNYTGFNTITSYLSLEPRDPALRRELFEAFRPSPLMRLLREGIAPKRTEEMFRLSMLLDVTHILRDDEKADMFPILSRNRFGYQPFSFPESNEVETYAYFTAIRPGFTAFNITADSTPLGSYWSTSPNSFGYQFNSGGVNGDMPTDIYRVTAGLVYKDLNKGTVDYGTYASNIVMTYKDTNNNRVRAPCEEPLFTVNGREQWIGLAMATNEILEVGDRISLGSLVFPPVPATIEASLTWPDGRMEQVQGNANRIGVFGRGVFTVDKPGVYRVKATASYRGKTGDVFGSGDGIFNHYVVEKHHPDILMIDLPPKSDFDVTKILEIPIKIRTGFQNTKVTYSVVSPGMIMDEGVFRPEDRAYVFRFIPSQFAMQFANFDITDYGTQRPKLNDSFFIIFFVEAASPQGETVFDVKKIMVRDRDIYYFNPAAWKHG